MVASKISVLLINPADYYKWILDNFLKKPEIIRTMIFRDIPYHLKTR